MEEIAPGIRHWKATHPNLGIEVSAYWLPELRLLLDPIGVPDEVEAVEHILLSCRHHVRDSLEAAERFGATVRAPVTGMHDFGDDSPIEPYDFGDPLAGGAVTAHQVGGLSPDETALHIPAANALSIADGAIRYGEELHFVPDQYMDDPEKDKAEIRRAMGDLAERLEFDVLLLAHGNPYPSGGREALRAFAGR
jgi:glyoxylase-like metal-dependent hydrolase (beta-lactamase superfamily II)